MAIEPRLTIVHLLPDLMNLYGDGGNVLALRRRCEWRGIGVDVRRVTAGQHPDLERCDVLFLGGGQDRDMARVAREMAPYGAAVRDWVADGGVALTICGGFQLFGREYVAPDGTTAQGIGVFDVVTRAGGPRLVGDLVVDPSTDVDGTGTLAGADGWLREGASPLVGFENHGGVTTLLPGARPLGRVLAGTGNGDGAVEGAVTGHAIGTYLHGALLPRNPWLADRLIAEALRRRGDTSALPELDDGLEDEARAAALRRSSLVA